MNDTPTVALVMPAAELMALAQLVKRLSYDDCERLSSRHATYDLRPEREVMWAAVSMLRDELAQAGFSPR
jgi:hypothetical protein